MSKKHDAVSQDEGHQAKSAMPHFVLRRGHRGRYRFTFMNDDATLSGEVQADQNLTDRAAADLVVQQKILEIAGAFALWMEKNVAGEHQDARSLLRHTIRKEWARRSLWDL